MERTSVEPKARLLNLDMRKTHAECVSVSITCPGLYPLFLITIPSRLTSKLYTHAADVLLSSVLSMQWQHVP